MHNGTESASVYFFFLLHDVPEFELAAYLPVFNLDELIVAGCHAAVLRKPLEASFGGETQARNCNEDSRGSMFAPLQHFSAVERQLKLQIWPTCCQLTSQGTRVYKFSLMQTEVVENGWTYPAEAGAEERKNRWLLLVGWPET